MRIRGIAILCAAALVAGGMLATRAHAATPDYAREERWASEIVPQLVVGDAIELHARDRPNVLALHAKPAGAPKGAVILVHGLGLHPDWGLIGTLRSDLADRGFVTLSVQMPVLAADAPREGYRDVMEIGVERIRTAVRWVAEHDRLPIAIVAHSLGAAMANAYLASDPSPRIVAFVPIGMSGAFASTARMPIEDVVAERDFAEVLADARVRDAKLGRDRCSRSVDVPGADHYFGSEAKALVQAIAPFLDAVFAGRCTRTE